jgi:chemotaxis protein CheD
MSIGVRMGEMAVSGNPTDELVALGLGSCIGLAIIDRSAGIAGLAHIVLPESGTGAGPAGKFADTAVPELLEQLRRAGAVERRYETALVGGARMFETTKGLDIGSRNEAAVRAALARARVTIKAHETGGSQGRTVKIEVATMLVTVRMAGAQPVPLFPGRGGDAHAHGALGAVPPLGAKLRVAGAQS